MNLPYSKSFLALFLAVVLPGGAQTLNLVPAWNLSPGSRPYLTTGANQRGLAYNPVTDHLLVVNRSGSLSVNILDASSGADLGTLNLGSLISGGTFALNMIGVGNDGAIYAGNLTLNGNTDPYRVYRWASESASPTLAFSGNPSPGIAQRYGDTMDVRGAAAGTEILLGSRTGTNAAVLTTGDGTTFASRTVATAAISPGDLGLGIAYGSGNTYWAKGEPGTTLRLIDLNSGALLQSYPASAFANGFSAIGVNPANALLAGLSIATPDRVVLYDIGNSISSSNRPVFLDSEIFGPNNANGSDVGSIDFGGGRLFVLNANNGVAAFNIIPEPAPYLLGLVGGAIGWAIQLRRRRAA